MLLILLNSPTILNFVVKTTTSFLFSTLLWLLLNLFCWLTYLSISLIWSLGLFSGSLLFSLYLLSQWSLLPCRFNHHVYANDCRFLAFLLSFGPIDPMVITICLFQKLLKLNMSKNRLIFLLKLVLFPGFNILLGNVTVCLALLFWRIVRQCWIS